MLGNEALRIRLRHESLDVTLAYLKGKDAESEEAQDHANSSSLAHWLTFGVRQADATFQQAALLGRSQAAPSYQVHRPFQTILAA